jgi:hypothetical protein
MMVKKGKRKSPSITNRFSSILRKRNPEITYAELSDSSPSLSRARSRSSSSGYFYNARTILKERRTDRGDIEYLVDWLNDSDSDQKFAPSWQPEVNVTVVLESHWINSTSAPGPQLTSDHSGHQALDRASTRSRRGRRSRRSIESSTPGPQISPPPLPSSPTPSSRGPLIVESPSQPSVVEHQATQETISSSQLAESEASVYIIIPPRHPQSLADYQTLSSSSQDSPLSFDPSLFGTAPQPDSPPRHQLASSRRRKFSLTAVIPDSQLPLAGGRYDSAEIASKVTFQNSPDQAAQVLTNDIIPQVCMMA